MKQIFYICTGLFFSGFLFGEPSPQVCLEVNYSTLFCGDTFVLEATADSEIPLYGVELEILYDPEKLEIRDCNSKKSGVQVACGDFFDPKRCNEVVNEVDLMNGRIKFMTSLVHPSDSRMGAGSIIVAGFKAKETGNARIQLGEIKFGTREGKTFLALAQVRDLNVQIKSRITVFHVFWVCLGSIIGAVFFWSFRRNMNSGEFVKSLV